MITKRSADTRGLLNQGWIQSRRTFSNNSYWDPRYMNYSSLKVINDDILIPGSKVPEHLHKEMNIFGYIVNGPCSHTDNLGNKQDVPSGSVQRMIAGTGIRHTEGNNFDNPIRYLQIWFLPSKRDSTPRWDYVDIQPEEKLNKFCNITDKLPIDTDAKFYAGVFNKDFNFDINLRNKYYVYIVNGQGYINNNEFQEGDGFAIEKEHLVEIKTQDSEVLVFELR